MVDRVPAYSVLKRPVLDATVVTHDRPVITFLQEAAPTTFYATASRTALAPSPMKSENPFAAGLTPARLGALEPVRQRGAGACGTVDCCHERESQLHTREGPPGGRHRLHQGVIRPQLTTELALAGPWPGPVSRAPGRNSTPGGFTSQPPRTKRESGWRRPGLSRWTTCSSQPTVLPHCRSVVKAITLLVPRLAALLCEAVTLATPMLPSQTTAFWTTIDSPHRRITAS